MNDQELINQINDLLMKATVAENPAKEEERVPIEQMFSFYNQIINSYELLSPKAQKTMKSSLYMGYSNLGHLYFVSKQYEESLSYLEKAKKLPEYKNDKFMFRFLIDHFIVSSKIKLYLKTNSKSYLKGVRGINNSLLNRIDKIESQNLKYEIDYNKSILQAIDRGGRIKTVICFEIPPAIPIQENTPINFKIDGIDHILKIEIIKNPSPFLESEGNGFVEIIDDKFGLVNRSKIKLTIFKYIDPDEMVEEKTFSEKELHPKVILEALDALNFFIERYRIVTGNYWIEPVFYKMIKNFTFENLVETQVHRSQSGVMAHSTRMSQTIPWLKNEEMHDLRKCLDKEEIPLWEILLLDAKDYLLKRSYRETIYAINGAFENYFMLKAQEKLSKAWGKKNAMEYLEGKPIYKYHKMRDYMDEETFKRAVKENKITQYVPSTYQILKECSIVYSSLNRSQLNNLVNKIRKRRNEVMHGVKIKDDLEIIAFEAIKNFEEFIKVFK